MCETQMAKYKFFPKLQMVLVLIVNTKSLYIEFSWCRDYKALFYAALHFCAVVKWIFTDHSCLATSQPNVPYNTHKCQKNEWVQEQTIVLSTPFNYLIHHRTLVPTCSPSCGGDVAVYVFNINQACLLLFILFWCLFLS